MMEIFKIFLLLSSIAFGHGRVIDEEVALLSSAMAQIADTKMTELVLVGDEKTEMLRKLLTKRLQKLEYPLFSFDLNYLKNATRLDKKCAIFRSYGNVSESSLEDMMGYNEAILAPTKSAKALFWMASDAEAVASSLNVVDGSVLLCPQIIDLGIWSENNHIFFWLQSDVERKDIFQHEILRHHPHLNVLVPTEQSSHENGIADSLLYCSIPCNAGHLANGLGVSGSLLGTLRDRTFASILRDPKQFSERKLHLSSVHAAIPPNSPIPKDKFLMLESPDVFAVLARKLNFTFVVVNPPEKTWSGMDSEGNYLGLIGVLARLESDGLIATGSQKFHFAKITRPDFSLHYGFWGFRTIAAPLAQSFPKSMALLYPFDLTTWIMLGLTTLTVAMALTWVAKYELKMIADVRVRRWEKPTFGRSLWFCIGSMCGENTARNPLSKRKAIYRLLEGKWLLMTFIVVTAFTGSLFSIMKERGKAAVINSVSDALQSGMTVYKVVHNSRQESLLESRGSEELRQLWKKALPQGQGNIIRYTKDLLEVAEGRRLHIDSFNLMRRVVKALLTTSYGKTLLHLPHYNAGMDAKAMVGIAFPKISRHGNTIGKALRALAATGVTVKAQNSKLLELRLFFLETAGYLPSVHPEADYAPLVLSDLLSCLLFGLTFTLLSLITLLCEAIWAIHEKKQTSQI